MQLRNKVNHNEPIKANDYLMLKDDEGNTVRVNVIEALLPDPPEDIFGTLPAGHNLPVDVELQRRKRSEAGRTEARRTQRSGRVKADGLFGGKLPNAGGFRGGCGRHA